MSRITFGYFVLGIILYFCISSIAAKGLITERELNTTQTSSDNILNSTTTIPTTEITEISTETNLSKKALMLARLHKIYDVNKLCNKAWFLENYVKHERYINIDDMRTVCNESHFHVCSGADIHHVWIRMMEGIINPKYFIGFHLDGINNNQTGCWGYAFEIVTADEKKTIYFNFKKKVESKTFKVHYKVAVDYVFRIGNLPRGRNYIFHWKSPGRCDLEVTHDVYLKLKWKSIYDECSSKINLTDLWMFAKNICLNHDTDTRRKLLKEKLDIINCKAVLLNKKQVNTNATKISLAISGGFLAVMIIVFILMVRKNKLKFCSAHQMTQYDLEDHDLDLKSTEPKVGTNVVIIHRPGCELLEMLVVEFAGLLKSYGIEVRMTLLEQTVADASGGVVYYMQKNIQQSDYVLILLTEPPEDDLLQRHRPYDFAIAMMQGMAIYCNAYSKFIPLYLTTYYQAIKYFPPFLNANTGYGYRLPHEAIRLIARLLETTRIKQPKEQKMKNKQFLGKIKELIKQMNRSKHVNCIKTHCAKGTQYPSTRNLSSIWSSTIESKWPSIRSMLGDDSYTTVDRESIFHYKFSSMNVSNNTIDDYRKALKVDLQQSCKGEMTYLATHMSNSDAYSDMGESKFHSKNGSSIEINKEDEYKENDNLLNHNGGQSFERT